jgi:putative PEP-CTERM system TPR-repeat lipoprotein
VIKLREREFAEAEELLRPVTDFNPEDVMALNLLANTLMAAGRPDEALEILQQVASVSPGSPQAQMRLGAGLIMQGDMETGSEQLRAVIESNPDFEQADMLLVLGHIQRQEFEQAVEAAAAYAERQPDSATPKILMGRVLVAQDKVKEAGDYLEQALVDHPGDAGLSFALAEIVSQQGDTARARSLLEQVNADKPGNLPTLLKLAQLEATEQDLAAMVRYLDEAVETNPRALQPRVALARYYLAENQPEKVAVTFTGLEDEALQSPVVLGLTARAQASQGEYSKSAASLQKLVELQPGVAQTRYQLAALREQLGQRSAARSQLESALEIDPAHRAARLMLARIELAEGSADKASEHLAALKSNAGDSADPALSKLEVGILTAQGEDSAALSVAQQWHVAQPSVDSVSALAALQERTGQAGESIATLQSWLADHPGDPGVRLLLAGAYTRQDRVDDAVPEYQKVLQDNPDNVLALNNLAWFLRKQDTAKALGYATRAVELAPQSADALDTLAMVYFEKGDFREAIRALQRALDIRPSNPTMLYHLAMNQEAAGAEDDALLTLQSIPEQSEFPEKSAARDLAEKLGGS